MNNILTKEFTLAEVLGAISGYLLVHQGFHRIHELFEWMVGNPVFTHQIPSVAPWIQKALTKQFPDFNLADNPPLASDIEILIDTLKAKDDIAASALLRELRCRYGDSFQVAPLQPFDEFEMPPLITDNIKHKVLTVAVQGDDFPDNI